MELQTIGQVAKNYNISVRMLRYYEQTGLITSIRKDECAYRFYDEENLRHLHLIIILRKLRISVKQISDILNNPDASATVEIFERNINELDEEITSLSTIKNILSRFTEELRTKAGMHLQFDLLNDKNTLSMIDSVSFSKNYLKENLSMEELNKANENLMKLQEKHIRIIYLPPATVASAHSVGGDPEHDSDVIMAKFMNDVDLFKINPGARFYGFNHDADGQHGYEVWGTIPDDLDVPAPLTKKKFAGGLYAAYTSKPVNFEEWKLLYDWISNNDDFDYDKREPFGMDGCLEEHFNSYNLYGMKNRKHILSHIDFLLPVKEKEGK